MRSLPLLLALLLLPGCALFLPTAPGPGLPQPVAAVDLDRYLGSWFEVARLPAPFQDSGGRRCVDVTASYTRRPDGRIAVLNRCLDANDSFRERSAIAVASVVEGSGNARLRVRFFWPFSADYWVIGLDPDYRWAVVGGPSRRFLWILSRTPNLPEAELSAARAIAAAQGYPVENLMLTPHGARP
ncbi:MAG: lipocalin family protein [Rhodovarius sp.]|nr:lipocalin family protein [Rhodovarius sp.]MCX7931933.1 lipocalin family protein [Rhodovarius sp.]